MRYARVLIVDDESSVRSAVKKILIKAFPHFDVDEACCGEEAIQMALHNHYNTILLDAVMPGMDGFDTCKELKKHESTKDIPVVFLTGLVTPDDEISAYDMGAVDYLKKPVNLPQLVAKISIHTSTNLDTRELKNYRDRMQDDIQKAQKFYQALLPTPEEVSAVEINHGVRLSSFFHAFNKVGGDLWKVKDIDEDYFAILLVDFSGHGVSSALNASYLNALLTSPNVPWGDVAHFLAYLNDHLIQVLSLGAFATASYVLVNSRTRVVDYCNCGSPCPARIRSADKSVMFLEEGTQPLGFFKSSSMHFQVGHVACRKDDFLLLYSDALIETKHKPEHKMWMHDGLRKALNKCAKESGDIDKFTYVNELFHKTSVEPLDDDLTLVGVVL